MAVPNHDHFSLQDVVDELIADPPTLQDCFYTAIDSYFDPAYKGSKDNLYNFRNFGIGITMRQIRIKLYPEYDNGYIKNEDTNWAVLIFGASGDTPYNSGNFLSRVSRSGSTYRCDRMFFTFDLRSVSETILYVSMKMRIVSGIWSHKIFFPDDIPYSGTLDNEDWNMVTEQGGGTESYALMFGTTFIKQGDASFYGVNSVGNDVDALGRFNTAKGTLVQLGSRHYDDWSSDPPADGLDYLTEWRRAVGAGNYVWDPELLLLYEGLQICIANPSIWNISDALHANKYMYITADTGNDWSASVTTGGAWLSITLGGTGNSWGWFKVQAASNPGGPRTGYITVSNDLSDVVITVNQEGVPECYAIPDPYAASYNDHNKIFQVVAHPDTNAWTASFVDTGDGIGWISFVGDFTGIGDGDFTVNIDNNDGVARSCDIKLVSDAASDYIIDVNQDAGGISGGVLEIDNQSNNTDDINIDVTPNTMDTTISKVNTGHGTSWFNITSGSAETGDFNLAIILAGTPPTGDRSAQVRIDDDDSGLYELVTVNYTYLV